MQRFRFAILRAHVIPKPSITRIPRVITIHTRATTNNMSAPSQSVSAVDADTPQVINSSMRKSLDDHFAAVKDEGDVWVRTSKAVVGRLAAPLLLRMGLAADGTEPVTLLDLAAGAGVVAQELHKLLPKATLEKGSILATDNAPGMLDIMNRRIADEGWINTKTANADAQDTKLPENSFSHVTACLALHLIPDPDSVVRDAVRVLQPGGVFGATTLPEQEVNAFWFGDMRSAFASFPFDAPFPDKMPVQMHGSGRWYDQAWLETHLPTLGLSDVCVTLIPGTYRVSGADEFLSYFAMMVPFLTKAFWSEETCAAHGIDEVTELVRKHLVDKYKGQGWDLDWDMLYMTGRADK